LIGTIIDGRYLVERVVGAGGFGVVFQARHVQFDSPAALKVLVRSAELGRTPARGGGPPTEGRLQFKLAPLHAAFVHVFEAGVVRCSQGRVLPYLALEWLHGVTLKSLSDSLRSEGHRLSLDVVLHLFDELARGLGVAHARRIAHRDLKPSNVFLAVTDGTVSPKLLDFGLAKQGAPARTPSKTPGSTPPVHARLRRPEQWDRRLGATGPWTDVYSFALMVSEFVAGRRWHEGLSSSELLRATLDDARRPTPGRLGAATSPDLEAVFAQALAVDPRRRYPDVERFWRALCDAAGFQHPGTPLLTSELHVVVPERAGSVRPSAPATSLAAAPRSGTTVRLDPLPGATTDPPASARDGVRGRLREPGAAGAFLPPAARAAWRRPLLLFASLGLAAVLAATLARRSGGPRSGNAGLGMTHAAARSAAPAPRAAGVLGAGPSASSIALPEPDTAGWARRSRPSPGVALPASSGRAAAPSGAGGASALVRGNRQALAIGSGTSRPATAPSSPRPTTSAVPAPAPGHPTAVLLEPPMLSRK
jgi:serine/threonine protein kinase